MAYRSMISERGQKPNKRPLGGDFHSFNDFDFKFKSLRIQVCPKISGLPRSIPILFGWDWNPQNPFGCGRDLDPYLEDHPS